MSDIVYLDICCFKRPFDDVAAERVRREAEAVAAVLDAVSDHLRVQVYAPGELPLPAEGEQV